MMGSPAQGRGPKDVFWEPVWKSMRAETRLGVWKSGGTVLRWKVCVGWQVETPELELELERDGHGQRGEESSWNEDCEEGWGLPGGWQGEHFVEQRGSGRKQRRRTLSESLWTFLRKDPMVCGVAWERDAPWDGV